MLVKNEGNKECEDPRQNWCICCIIAVVGIIMVIVIIIYGIDMSFEYNDNEAILLNACVTSVRIGSSRAAGGVPPCPWKRDHSFFFVSDPSMLEIVNAQKWTAVLLNLTQIPFNPHTGPTKMSELGWTQSDVENMQAKYVKILSHRIPELNACDLVLYMDSKLFYSNHIVKEIFSKCANSCVTLFKHEWRFYTGAFLQEVDCSYHQPRYLRFKPAIDKQIDYHHNRRGESFDGVMHLGGTHVFNLRDREAVRFQNSWWNETLAYSIQDQLSLFWQLQPFQQCVESWVPMYGGPVIRFLLFLLFRLTGRG